MRDGLQDTVNLVAGAAGFPRQAAVLEHVCLPAQPFVTAALLSHHPSQNGWVVCEDSRTQEEILNGLLNWHCDALFFPEIELIEGAIPDPEVTSERLAILQRLASGKRVVIVVTAATLADQVPAKESLRRQTIVIRRGDRLIRDDLLRNLVAAGYARVDQVTARGEFATRGGIIDLFSPQQTVPVRLELLGDEVESLREFDLDEQTAVQIVERCELIVGATEGTVELASYIKRRDYIVAIETAMPTATARISAGALVETETQDFTHAFYFSGFHDFEAGDFLVEEHKRAQALEQINQWLSQNWRVLAICHNEGETERLKDVLRDNDVDVDRLNFAIGTVNAGFTYPAGQLAILSDAEIFGRYQSPSARRLSLRRSRLRGGRTPIDFSELEEGDYVVHLEHGIARYQGIQKLQQGNAQTDCVALEFEEGARLYVPFEQAFLISRYVGVGKRIPTLSQLGDSKWAKAKKAAENAVFDYAARLLQLQAERNTLNGFSFPPDTKWQVEFESSFLFKETPDQLKAIEQTKEDMESEQPMDRLICGDVGFGKTEVAIRAAFKAVMSGKQVAMLVPTTVLAQQHYQTFRERMSDYPVRVAVLSRFLSNKEEKQTVESVRNGSIDIVVGTHRLVSPDVEFKNLGLVVIDEEQRFGVRHKERLKERFKLIDVLTLSATPIPRTLYLSLVGAKDMSTIETAPPNRLPVETVICAYDERIIRDAIQRELRRRGQVYFLHNRVHSIYHVKERIKTLFPKIRVEVGHGQMDESELELVMQRFVAGDCDVLISTTIIESGLDIPNANTIIIDRADRFGLADLYQLRGRVGRAQHKAYAFLLLPRELLGAGAARSRINAIKQYSDLGAGFKIAMRDLEIRGAGNILGTAQSGHIINVGFDLYCQLLQQAVDQLKGKKSRSIFQTAIHLDFVTTNESEFLTAEAGTIPAFIPADYIPKPQTRIQAYKKLAAATAQEHLQKLEREWRDRFGPLPTAAENLLLLNRVRLHAARAKISRIEVKDHKVMLMRGGDYVLVGDRFPRLTAGKPQLNLGELQVLIQSLT